MMLGPPFRGILATQWHWSRLGLAPAAVAAFAIPVLSIQLFDDPTATGFRIQFLLNRLADWAPAYPLLAAGVGLLLGMSAWSADHRGRHVYALSLPLPRWKFTWYRAAAGMILLALPVSTLFLGAVLASLTAEVPPTLRVYPIGLTVRFTIAALVAFATFFAVSAGTARTAGALLIAVVLLGLAQLMTALFGLGLDLLSPVADAIMSWPGPLEVFGGRWLLIDY